MRLGVPYDRLCNWQFTQTNELGRYDLVCLSDPRADVRAWLEAAKVYVEQGGVLILEDLMLRRGHWGRLYGMGGENHLFGDLEELKGDRGAKSVVKRFRHMVHVLPNKDAETDIDTVGDYDRLTAS